MTDYRNRKSKTKQAVDKRFKNRIVGYEDVSIEQIQFNPKNWRIHPKHQQEALRGVIGEVGIVQNVIINRSTGNLLDGHLRVIIADRNGEQTIPATIVDITQEEEDVILATLDPLSALAATDQDKLDALLQDIKVTNGAVLNMLGLDEYDGSEPDMVRIDKEDPKVTWVVLCCPTVKFGTISEHVGHIANAEGVYCEIIVSD